MDEFPISQDFEMSYPCRFAIKGNGYRKITCDGKECFVLFTDRYNIEDFITELGLVTVEAHTLPTPGALLELLRDMEKGAAAHGLSHIAIDPLNGKVGIVSIREFIEDLAKQDTR